MKQFFILLLIAVSSFSSPAQIQKDSLKIPWPASWKIGFEDNTDKHRLVEYVPANQTVENWTILGTMRIIKGINNVPIELTMNLMFSEAKKTAIDPTLTVIDKKADGEHPWILFKIESSKFKNDDNPESQLFYIVEGKNDLYSNFVSLKKAVLPKEFVDQWAEIFKASHFVE